MFGLTVVASLVNSFGDGDARMQWTIVRCDHLVKWPLFNVSYLLEESVYVCAKQPAHERTNVFSNVHIIMHRMWKCAIMQVDLCERNKNMFEITAKMRTPHSH